MDQYFNDHYKKFKEKRNKKQFKFYEYFFDYVNGNKEKFKSSWKMWSMSTTHAMLAGTIGFCFRSISHLGILLHMILTLHAALKRSLSSTWKLSTTYFHIFYWPLDSLLLNIRILKDLCHSNAGENPPPKVPQTW